VDQHLNNPSASVTGILSSDKKDVPKKTMVSGLVVCAIPLIVEVGLFLPWGMKLEAMMAEVTSSLDQKALSSYRVEKERRNRVEKVIALSFG